jgi:hypothetical protein
MVSNRHLRIEGHPRLLTGGDRHNHRLADGTRHRQHERRSDARKRGGQHHPEHGRELARAQRIRALAQIAGHRRDRVLAERSDHRDDHHPHHDAGAERVEAGQIGQELLQHRRQGHQREVAVDVGRHPCEQLEGRLENPAHTLGREFTEVDRSDQPERQRHGDRDRGGQERSGQQRPDPEVLVREQRRPLAVAEELHQRNLGEEVVRLAAEDHQDGRGGHDGQQCASQQAALDQRLAHPSHASRARTLRNRSPRPQQVLDPHADLGAGAAIDRAGGPRLEPITRQTVRGFRQRDVADLLHQRRALFEVELDERGDHARQATTPAHLFADAGKSTQLQPSASHSAGLLLQQRATRPQ